MLQHTGTLCLQTPRLLLRPLRVDDCHAMFEGWANDPAVTRWLRWQPHKDWVFTAELLSQWQRQAEIDPAYYGWGVARKEDGALMGSISLFPSPDGDGAGYGEFDQTDGVWEPGYCLGRAFWGQGYATEALAAVCAHWFDAVGGGWLSCCHAVQNPASGRVMQKVGFCYHHDSVYHKFDGTPVECRCYALRKEDFKRI